MPIVSIGDSLHEMSDPGNNEKNINLPSAEFAQTVVVFLLLLCMKVRFSRQKGNGHIFLSYKYHNEIPYST